MQTTNLLEQLQNLITPLLDSINLRLWGLEFVGTVLRIYIEKKPESLGVAVEDSTPDFEALGEAELASVDDCAEASRLIGLTLDVEDVIESAYVLEVSTPGLERRFFKPEQLTLYPGRLMEALMFKAPASHPKRKKFTGHLLSTSQGDTGWNFNLRLLETLPNEEGIATLDWASVKKARLLYEDKAQQPKSKNPDSSKKRKESEVDK